MVQPNTCEICKAIICLENPASYGHSVHYHFDGYEKYCHPNSTLEYENGNFHGHPDKPQAAGCKHCHKPHKIISVRNAGGGWDDMPSEFCRDADSSSPAKGEERKPDAELAREIAEVEAIKIICSCSDDGLGRFYEEGGSKEFDIDNHCDTCLLMNKHIRDNEVVADITAALNRQMTLRREMVKGLRKVLSEKWCKASNLKLEMKNESAILRLATTMGEIMATEILEAFDAASQEFTDKNKG